MSETAVSSTIHTAGHLCYRAVGQYHIPARMAGGKRVSDAGNRKTVKQFHTLHPADYRRDDTVRRLD